MWARADSGARDAAVLDIGSNSVRLVIYRLEGRAIWTVFNEKVLAGLGRGVAQSGRLSPEGVRDARAALRRFRAVLNVAKPDQIFTAATAAVRDAEDGAGFLEAVRRDTGFRVRILSGEEEARYAALGAIAGAPASEGLVGDLGGSSLELTPVGGGVVGDGVTLELGPFALGAPKPLDPPSVRSKIDKRLGGVRGRFKARTLHAVGGAWRNLGLIHMSMTDYPLRVVHQYEMTARQAVETAQFAARQSRASLERTPGVSRKRAETLPYAALVLERLVQSFDLQRVVFSAYGVREGMLYESLSDELRARDPLVEGCAALGARLGVVDALGPAAEVWLRPVFDTLPPVFEDRRDAVLLAAACRLIDTGARLHPDHRASLTAAQVLRAPIPGQSHPERGFLATAAFSRYTTDPGPPEARAVLRVLSDDRLKRARAVGACMRLAADLCGRNPELLQAADLTREDGKLVLTVDPGRGDVVLGEQVPKRLCAAAEALDLKEEVRTEGVSGPARESRVRAFH